MVKNFYFPLRLFFFCILSFSSCDSNKPTVVTEFSGNEMTINYRILIGKKLNTEEVERVEVLIKSSFNEINNIHNKWNPYSELSHLNRLKAHVKIPISNELAELFHICDEVYSLTKGCFDPTIESLQQLWKMSLSKGVIPKVHEIEKLLPAVGWEHIHVEEGFFWKEHEATQIDLGGLAKGHLVDKLSERLKLAGFKDVYVDWGGEIKAFGRHPQGRPWKIFITGFGNTDPAYAIDQLTLENLAIATSGDYEQCWNIVDGKHKICLFHIIDPKTGRFLERRNERVASASIVAPSCAIADGLATAALCFETKSQAEEWVKELSKQMSLKYWFISRD